MFLFLRISWKSYTSSIRKPIVFSSLSLQGNIGNSLEKCIKQSHKFIFMSYLFIVTRIHFYTVNMGVESSFLLCFLAAMSYLVKAMAKKITAWVTCI